MLQPKSNSSLLEMSEHITSVNADIERSLEEQVAAAAGRLMSKHDVSSVSTLDKYFGANSTGIGNSGAERVKAFEGGLGHVRSAAIKGMADGIRASFSNAPITVNGQPSDQWGKLGVAATQGFTSGLGASTGISLEEYRQIEEAMAEYLRSRRVDPASKVTNQRVAGLMRRVAKQNAIHAQNEHVAKIPPLRTTFAREAEKMRKWGKNVSAAAVLNAQLTASVATRKIASVGKFFTSKARELKTGATELLHSQAVKRTIKVGSFVAACSALGALTPHLMTAMPNASEVGHSVAHHGHQAVQAVGDIHHHAQNAIKAAARTGHHLAQSGMRSVIHGGHKHIETASQIVKSASIQKPDVSADILNMQQLQKLHDPAKTIIEHSHHLTHTSAHVAEIATKGGVAPTNPLAAEVAENMHRGGAAKLSVPVGQQLAHAAKSTFIDQPSAFFKGMTQAISDLGSQMSSPHHQTTTIADARRYTQDYPLNTPR